jgi:hypothetical protein
MDPIKSKLMAALADVNQQEWALSSALSSVVGRHVYFCIARQVWSTTAEAMDPALKQLLQHPAYSDRAVRLKLREMEAEGLIAMDVRYLDRRSRSLMPTDRLLDIYEAHAERAQNSFFKDFYLVEKGKN